MNFGKGDKFKCVAEKRRKKFFVMRYSGKRKRAFRNNMHHICHFNNNKRTDLRTSLSIYLSIQYQCVFVCVCVYHSLASTFFSSIVRKLSLCKLNFCNDKSVPFCNNKTLHTEWHHGSESVCLCMCVYAHAINAFAHQQRDQDNSSVSAGKCPFWVIVSPIIIICWPLFHYRNCSCPRSSSIQWKWCASYVTARPSVPAPVKPISRLYCNIRYTLSRLNGLTHRMVDTISTGTITTTKVQILAETLVFVTHTPGQAHGIYKRCSPNIVSLGMLLLVKTNLRLVRYRRGREREKKQHYRR